MDNGDKIVDVKIQLCNVKRENELRLILPNLRLIASNFKSDPEVLEVIEGAIIKALEIDDKKTLVNLLGLKFLQLELDAGNKDQIIEILDYMRLLAIDTKYNDGLAYAYSFEWFIQRFSNNKRLASNAIKEARNLLNESVEDPYIFNFVNCSYGIELWLEQHNPECISIFEECLTHFYNQKLYRSYAQTLGVLLVIYQELQNTKKASQTIKKILCKRNSFIQAPKDIEALTHFFIGLCHKLSFKLDLAEISLIDSSRGFKETSSLSMYSGYHVTALFHLSAVYALKGKLELSLEQIQQVMKFIESKDVENKTDISTRNQVKHTFDLTKFYVYSRYIGFHVKKNHELTKRILKGIKTNYSNTIMLSEFLLNANLNHKQLLEIQDLENNSIVRIKNIIKYIMEKSKHNIKTSKKERVEDCIRILKGRTKLVSKTLIEEAFSDILIAQELFTARRYAEIYPLLKKYKKQIHRIEVLELRIFMDAFIQTGEFNNGDPLAPALHFMAIKRCREHNFTRLEETLLDHQQTLRRIALNRLT